MSGPPAVTTIASYGACSGQPSVPSPCRTWTLSKPSVAQPGRGSCRPARRGARWCRPRVRCGRGSRPRSPSPCRSRARGRRVRAQGPRHQRDDVGLRDRLPLGDRERGVLVGELRELGREERLARDRPHGLEDGGRPGCRERRCACGPCRRVPRGDRACEKGSAGGVPACGLQASRLLFDPPRRVATDTARNVRSHANPGGDDRAGMRRDAIAPR